jgi:hypothetical protein
VGSRQASDIGPSAAFYLREKKREKVPFTSIDCLYFHLKLENRVF